VGHAGQPVEGRGHDRSGGTPVRVGDESDPAGITLHAGDGTGLLTVSVETDSESAIIIKSKPLTC
jgi:hypothetical protein